MNYYVPLTKTDFEAFNSWPIETWRPCKQLGFERSEFHFCTLARTLVAAVSDGEVVKVYHATPKDIRETSHRDNLVIRLEDGIYVCYTHILPSVHEGEKVTAQQQVGIQNNNRAYGTHSSPRRWHFHLGFYSDLEISPKRVRLKSI
ncbi:MAG TPA: hypothetical protein VJC07_05120 [Candidatus Nanoarchaeia archaeon]|nr:hypothetical protein [Candidatus Nanoarchaeia archaeon]